MHAVHLMRVWTCLTATAVGTGMHGMMAGGVQTSARLKDGLCVGAPADPDVVEEARRLSFKGTVTPVGAALSLRSRTACTGIRLSWVRGRPGDRKDVGTSLISRHFLQYCPTSAAPARTHVQTRSLQVQGQQIDIPAGLRIHAHSAQARRLLPSGRLQCAPAAAPQPPPWPRLGSSAHHRALQPKYSIMLSDE